MKTQEKNFDGIKISGFTAIFIMLALTGTAIYLLSLSQISSTIAGVICGICVAIMIPGFMIIQPNNSRVCRNSHKQRFLLGKPAFPEIDRNITHP